MHKVLRLRRIHLFEFAGNKEGRDADELQASALDGDLRQEAVDDVHSEPQRRGVQLELVVHLDEPVDQNRAHFVVQVFLGGHVRVHGVLGLWFTEKAMNERVG